MKLITPEEARNLFETAKEQDKQRNIETIIKYMDEEIREAATVGAMFKYFSLIELTKIDFYSYLNDVYKILTDAGYKCNWYDRELEVRWD